MFLSRISSLLKVSKRANFTSKIMQSTSHKVHIQLFPSSCGFFDEPVHVKVEGLAPHQKVELRSECKDHRGVVFRGSSLYNADATGQVDVCSSAALSGTYTGVEPMGLLWSMAPETTNTKMVIKNALSPILVNIDALNESGEVLASETCERRFMMEGVRRIQLQEEKIRGVLFLPPGKGPFPGVLDLYTLDGGTCESRASLLANKGFVVLALAFYRYEDLPRTLPKKFDLEYFEAAVEFLRGQPQVQGPGIGVISISKSGDLALSMASFLSGISATVCINGSNSCILTPLHYKDIIIPPLIPALDKIVTTPAGLLDIRDCLPDPMASERSRQSMLPIERASCQFLFVASEDDRNWNSLFFAEQSVAKLRGLGKTNFELVRYPKAGHFLEVPYMPFCPSSLHLALGKEVVFGGNPKANSEAQLDLWSRVQKFFRKHLGIKNHDQKSFL